MKLPEDFWLFYLIAGLLGLSWILSEVDRTGQRFTTPAWERFVVVAGVMIALRLIHRRIR
jgi:hypothetical protein